MFFQMKHFFFRKKNITQLIDCQMVEIFPRKKNRFSGVRKMHNNYLRTALCVQGQLLIPCKKSIPIVTTCVPELKLAKSFVVI